MAGYDLKKEEDVQEYIKNLGIEYQFGCYHEKKPQVCHLLGDYLESIKKEFDKAAKIYKTNCDEFNFSKSCLKYGNYCVLGKGIDKKNDVDALSYYSKACELNEPTACLHSGVILIAEDSKGVKQDVKKGMEYLEKSCTANVEQACFYLSGMYIRGVQKPDPSRNPHKPQDSSQNKEFLIPSDMKKAFEYTVKSCELSNMYACSNLSRMYSTGQGVDKDEIKAAKYKKIAVELQEEVKNAKELKFQQGL